MSHPALTLADGSAAHPRKRCGGFYGVSLVPSADRVSALSAKLCKAAFRRYTICGPVGESGEQFAGICGGGPYREGAAAPSLGMDEQVEGNHRGPRTPAGQSLRCAKSLEESRELSTGEAAPELGITERTVRRAIARGELTAVRRFGVYRIASQELARFAAQLELSTTPQPVARVTILASPDQSFAPLPAPLSSFIGRESERKRRCWHCLSTRRPVSSP